MGFHFVLCSTKSQTIVLWDTRFNRFIFVTMSMKSSDTRMGNDNNSHDPTLIHNVIKLCDDLEHKRTMWRYEGFNAYTQRPT